MYMNRIVLIGAGGHAKTIVDTIERLGTYEIAGFIAQGEVGTTAYRGYKILGNDENATDIYELGIHYAVIAIGFLGKLSIRQQLMDYYANIGFEFPVIIDPTAIVAHDVRIGEGTYIGRNVVVNADASIGKACIINTGAIIEHECSVGDFSHIAVAAVVCGQSEIGKNVLVGANATIIQNVVIEDDSIVGAGALVRKKVSKMSKIVKVDQNLGG